MKKSQEYLDYFIENKIRAANEALSPSHPPAPPPQCAPAPPTPEPKATPYNISIKKEPADNPPDTPTPTLAPLPKPMVKKEPIEPDPRPICKDFIRQLCTRTACQYRHEIDVSQLRGIFTFCHNYQNNVCVKPNCRFVHATVFEEHAFYRTGQMSAAWQKQINDIQQTTNLPAQQDSVANSPQASIDFVQNNPTQQVPPNSVENIYRGSTPQVSQNSVQNNPQSYNQQVPQNSVQNNPQSYTQQVTQNYMQNHSQDSNQRVSQNCFQNNPQCYTQQVPPNYVQIIPQNYTQPGPQSYVQNNPRIYTQEMPPNYAQNNPQSYSQQVPQNSQFPTQQIPQYSGYNNPHCSTQHSPQNIVHNCPSTSHVPTTERAGASSVSINRCKHCTRTENRLIFMMGKMQNLQKSFDKSETNLLNIQRRTKILLAIAADQGKKMREIDPYKSMKLLGLVSQCLKSLDQLNDSMFKG